MCLEEVEMTGDESSDQHSDMDTSPTTTISPEQMDTKLYNKCVTFMIRKPFPHDYIMGLRCYSKTRMASSFNTVDMHFPYSCWIQMTKTLNHLAKQKLPPATADFKEQSGHLLETHKFVGESGEGVPLSNIQSTIARLE